MRCVWGGRRSGTRRHRGGGARQPRHGRLLSAVGRLPPGRGGGRAPVTSGDRAGCLGGERTGLGSAGTPRLRRARGEAGGCHCSGSPASPPETLMVYGEMQRSPVPSRLQANAKRRVQLHFVALRDRESFVGGCQCGFFQRVGLKSPLVLLTHVLEIACSYTCWKEKQRVVSCRLIPAMWCLTDAARG